MNHYENTSDERFGDETVELTDDMFMDEEGRVTSVIQKQNIIDDPETQFLSLFDN